MTTEKECTCDRPTQVGDIVLARVPMNIGDYSNVVWPPGEPHRVKVVEIWEGHNLWRVALTEQLGPAPPGTTYSLMPSHSFVDTICPQCDLTSAECSCP